MFAPTRYERRGWVTYSNKTDIKDVLSRLSTKKVSSYHCPSRHGPHSDLWPLMLEVWPGLTLSRTSIRGEGPVMYFPM